jgi:glycosyltransferase involved in cell wall biosynthesis
MVDAPRLPDGVDAVNDITVCIPTIPPRAKMLARALESVAEQTLQPAAIIVEYDHEHTGAAATKNRALAKVTTPLVAFLDDDDHFLPHHLAVLH